jgi:imidazolonepropionase-like amidohydrolase
MKTRTLALLIVASVTCVSAQRVVIRTRTGQIVVEAGKIASVSAGPAKDTPTYDLSKFTVMPGWIDTHVHAGAYFDQKGKAVLGGPSSTYSTLAGAANMWATLEAGFTTVQSLGAASDKDLRESISALQIPGPRLLTSVRQINENTGGGDPEKLRAMAARNR